MGKVKLVADTACDLELSYFKEYDIDIMPLNVILNGVQYKDLIELDSKELYREMKYEGKTSTTSQAVPEAFIDKFKEIFDNGYDSIIYMGFSSNLSGTYQASVIASREFEGKDITLIDTKCASLGYGLVVLKAGRMLKAGASKEEIIKEVQRKINNTEHIFIVDDLTYLKRGGRISFAKAMLGTMLDLRPIMHVEDGKLFPFSKAKGKKKTLLQMVETMKERITDENETIGICDADDRETAMELEKLILKEMKIKEVIHTNMGCAVGSHVGPGCIALFFEGKHDYINV